MERAWGVPQGAVRFDRLVGTAIAANRPTVESAGNEHRHPIDVFRPDALIDAFRPVHGVREADLVHHRTHHGRDKTVGDRIRGNLDLNVTRGMRNDRRRHIARPHRLSVARHSHLTVAVRIHLGADDRLNNVNRRRNKIIG